MRYKRGKKSRGKVEWVDRTGALPAPFARKLPTFTGNTHVPDEYANELIVGTLWFATTPLDFSDVSDAPNEIPTISPTWSQNPDKCANIGSIMIYAGEIRRDERGKGDMIVSAIRHAFVSNGRLGVINHFSNVRPISRA